MLNVTRSERRYLFEIPGRKVNVSYDGLRRMVRQEFGIDAIKICNETRERQDAILKEIKEVAGMNIHQIARITWSSSTGSGRSETESMLLWFLWIRLGLA